MVEDTDTSLFALIKQGNKDALSDLFITYYDYLLHYGLRIKPNKVLVEECIQELFLYIFQSHDRLGSIKNEKAYLFSALRRRVLEKLQKEQQQNGDLHQLLDADIQFYADDLLLQEESQSLIRETLLQVLNNLPSRQREAIYLRYYNGLSTKEIAGIMGVANQTILNTLHQALRKIRESKQLKQIFGSTVS